MARDNSDLIVNFNFVFRFPRIHHNTNNNNNNNKMNLLADYSDSESDSEAPSAPKIAAKPAPKPSFQKVVDRSNPGRIKVNLPGASQSRQDKDDIQDDAPPAKKPRLGGQSSFGGFNAMLPAPKKPNVNAISASESAKTGSRGLGKGLASGVNLKTGAEPAFKREPRVETDEYDETGNPIKKEPMKKEDFRAMLNLPPPKTEVKKETQVKAPAENTQPTPAPQHVPKPAAPRFVPMSVGKGKKKKPVVPRPTPKSTDRTSTPSTNAQDSQALPTATAPRKPKVSLFGVSNEPEPTVSKAPTDTQYQPLLYGADEEQAPTIPSEPFLDHSAYTTTQPTPTPSGPSDLTNIASELNLTPAERRQLFGKQRRDAPDLSSAHIAEFNTDAEYAHNERLRQQGEAVSHNPLKSITGTGKNSLRSLVNVATTQKEALEDHFAAGHRNKKEAGNRYGW
ncbi:conserved hypothetical protein [Pyrenophora tritici-repentis Pt-1C-BFP]|uniref:PRCC domain containing protein n=3 Tax=Pyrenophora tritici-repentis TaxID=45151 RepID=A0A922N962_9PLEO|nr:uncharacterized protein PTRG_09626 [Pyrenophora tritici-repentis Pt-1C-BFP]EDU42677.1 conserved hypothetical protein [Pyrenophora tritici-repentis Pt-1C-BFP]KAI1511952.1 PRCC domain containing protein [Pyrenophora tritici-repentis]